MKRQVVKTVSLALSILLLLSGIPLTTHANAGAEETVYDVSISDVDQQTVKGWGVFPAWNRADWNRYFTDKTGAQQALFQDLGASLYRVMIPAVAGDGNGNLIEAKMQEIYEIIEAGANNGMDDYIISVWSPPIGMKTHPTVNGWTGTEHVRLRVDKEETYANYLVDAIEWLMDQGASEPHSLSFQNEPLSQIISEWCYWGGDNGAQYQRFAKLLRSKLDAAGLEQVQLLGPEGAAYHENELLLGQNFSALNNDAELYNAIGGLASHSYFSRGYDNDASYKAFREVLSRFPEKDIWQTEYSTLIEGVSEMDMAINAARRLTGDMALMETNYWFWWLGWALNRYPTDVGEVLLSGDGYTVTKSKAFYALSNIFNNVPVGSKVRRVSADPASGLVTSDAVWMDGVAFVDGSKTVVLLVNSTDRDTVVNVKGLTGTTADVYQLTGDIPAGQDMELAASRNIAAGTAPVIGLPAKSVSVIVTSDEDTAPPLITFDQSDSSSLPDAGYAVRESQFTVSGHLDEAGTLLINGQPVDVAADLSFSATVTLQPGDNTITAVATDLLNNEGNPVQLFIRHDSSYLGVSLDQSGPLYVRDSAFEVSGRTNGSAAVRLKHLHDDETVKEETFNVGGGDSGGPAAGETIRQIFNDNYVLTTYNLPAAQGGLTTAGAQAVRDGNGVFAAAEGEYSARLKLPELFSRIGFTFMNGSNAATPDNFAGIKDTAALQFWVYTPRYEASFSAVLVSDNDGTAVEARLPLTNYIDSSDFGPGAGWVQVTVPLADFDAAAHYDIATNETTELSLMWDKVKGIGFASHTAAFYDPRVDDVQIVSQNDSPPTPASPLTFGTELTLRTGENTIIAEASNGLGQEGAPATLTIYYDPDPPVLTVPAEGTTSGTSYVLNGSVNEEAVVTVNGVPTALKPDRTFTAVVPVVKGGNTIVVEATDLAGNVAQATVHVDADPVEDGALASGVAAAGRTAEAPVIDGELSEAGWNVNNRVEKMITGTSDNNITFGTMWDDAKLYVAVQVLDANLVNDSEQAYQDDSVEIYIDGDNSRSAVYGTDDHQITLGWHDAQLAVGGDIAGIEFAQTDIEGGFAVEMAIPWSGIGIEPPPADSVIGFDVAYNDDDGNGGGNRESQLMWHGNGDNWRSTAAFGSIVLTDGRNAAVALEPSGSLTLDGALDESSWTLGNNVAKNIVGTSNNSVRFGALADAQYLYVGIEVLDAELRNDSAQVHQDDSIEIYIDADHNRGAAYDANDYQLTIRWNDGELYGIGELEGVQFAQQDVNGGFTVEATIPWESLDVTPYRDMTLGFDIGNNDDDGNNGGNRDSQLMWNGTGDNWRDTSAFGSLLIHNLSLPLPDTSEPEPEGLVEFHDDASDLTKLHAKSASIINASGHPDNFSGDAGRITHQIDNPATAEYVVYHSPEGDIYSFDIATGLFSNTPQFKFYSSADGETYAPVLAASTLTGGANGYGVFSNTASGLPEGTRYLKIEFPGMANWMEQLLDVRYNYFGESTEPPVDPPGDTATFVDEAGDLTLLYDKSANIGNSLGGDLPKYGGDGTRIIVTKDDIMEPEYIVYQSPDGDIVSFDINVTFWVSLPPSAAYTIYVSEDGEEYAALPVAPVMLGTSSGYNTLSIPSGNVPAGSRYLKIVFPYGNEIYDNWTFALNKVTFDYIVSSTEEPDDGVVSATAALTGPAAAAAGDTFEVAVALADVEGNIAAQDLKVTYDANVLEFVSANETQEGFDIVGRTEGEGELRFILAAMGVEHAVSGDGEVLRLSFLVKPQAQASTTAIAIADHVIAGRTGLETTVTDVSFNVLIQYGDVNGDGKVSVGDLGIVVGYYGKLASDPEWDSYSHADVNRDGKIDIVDIAMVASRILNES